MKTKARLSETGQPINAEFDEDWAVVRTRVGGKSPALYCPDDGCGVRVDSVELPADGKVTRYFRYAKGTRKCGHQEVKRGIVVSAESEEHKWLKAFVKDVALSCGYSDVSLEKTLGPRVRADVYVPAVRRGRVEVQRGETDISRRTDPHDDVIWLLRAAYETNNTDALFRLPCVRVRITRKDKNGRWVIAHPWMEAGPSSVCAIATVLRPSFKPDQTTTFGFFEPQKNLPLETFLREVWSGERTWQPPCEVHSFAGWVLESDEGAYRSWVAQRAANRAVPLAAAPRAARPLAAADLARTYPAEVASCETPDLTHSTPELLPDQTYEVTASVDADPGETKAATPKRQEITGPTVGVWVRFRRWLLGT